MLLVFSSPDLAILVLQLIELRGGGLYLIKHFLRTQKPYFSIQFLALLLDRNNFPFKNTSGFFVDFSCDFQWF
jgi:hypothetical protein